MHPRTPNAKAHNLTRHGYFVRKVFSIPKSSFLVGVRYKCHRHDCGKADEMAAKLQDMAERDYYFRDLKSVETDPDDYSLDSEDEPPKADDADSVTMPSEGDLHNTPPGDGADEELPLDDDNDAGARAPQPMPAPTRADAAPQGKQPFTFMNTCGWARQLLWDAQIESCFPIYLTRKQLGCRVLSIYTI